MQSDRQPSRLLHGRELAMVAHPLDYIDPEMAAMNDEITTVAEDLHVRRRCHI
ncbi:MAG: hypothetical protein ACLRMJ_08450 [Alistipes finegoldii]